MSVLALDLAKRTRVALLWWTVGVVAMGAYVVGVYDTLGDVEDIAEFYEQLPPALREFIGDADISTIDGWLQIEFMSWVPLILAIYGGIFAAGSVSREVEQRTVDFVLGLPVSRVHFIASRLIIGVWNLLLMCVVIFVLMTAGVALTGHSVHADNYALAVFNAFLLSVALLTSYIALATFVDEQSKVTGITIGVTLVLWIASVALQAADAPEVVRWLTPFEHYQSAEAMAGKGVAIGSLAVLAVASIAGASVAFYWYNRRDIAI